MRAQRALQPSSCAAHLAGSLCTHSASRSPHWASWGLVLFVTPAHGQPRALHSVLGGQGGLWGQMVWARATKPHPDLKRPLHFVSTQRCVTFAHRLSLTSPKGFFQFFSHSALAWNILQSLWQKLRHESHHRIPFLILQMKVSGKMSSL